MFDLLIRNADIVDGTGSPRRRGDIAIRDGRIAEIGKITESSKRVIDAEGRIVAPGFVDVHTHLDVQGFWDPTLSPSPLHGVTTVMGGNCGFSVAPLSSSTAEYLMRMLARVEGMPLVSLEQGVPWDWTTTGEFLDRLDGTLAINAGFSVGHSALRRQVMGAAAVERAATLAEVERMKQLLRHGLAAGAMGFSSTWASTHNDADGNPVPSRHATAEEIVSLAAVCRDFEGTSLEFLPVAAGPFPEETAQLMIDMSVAAQRPLNWNILTVTAATLDGGLEKLAVGERANAAGGKVVGLTMPIHFPARFNFLSGFVLDALPGWEKAMALAPQDKLALLRSAERRGELNELAQRPSPLRSIARWENKTIVETFTDATKQFEGRTVGDIAAEHGKEPFDALLDIVCDDDLRTSFIITPPVFSAADWDAKIRVCRDRRAVIGASDAGAHLDMLATFNYTTRFLAEAVRERNMLPIEEAVHLLTDVPARLYGLRDRGVVTDGAFADLVIFDEDSIGSQPVWTNHDLPAGAGRLFAEATGIDHVLVNGVEIAAAGSFTGAMSGTLLRAGRDTATPQKIRDAW